MKKLSVLILLLASCTTLTSTNYKYITIPPAYEMSNQDVKNFKVIDKFKELMSIDTTQTYIDQVLNEVIGDSLFFLNNQISKEELSILLSRLNGGTTKDSSGKEVKISDIIHPMLSYLTCFNRREKISGNDPILFSYKSAAKFNSRSIKVYVFAHTLGIEKENEEYEAIQNAFKDKSPTFLGELQPFIYSNGFNNKNLICYFSVDTLTGKLVAFENEYYWRWDSDLKEMTYNIPNRSAQVKQASEQEIHYSTFTFVGLKVSKSGEPKYIDGAWENKDEIFWVFSDVHEFETFNEDMEYRFLDRVQSDYISTKSSDDYKILDRRSFTFYSYAEASKEREKLLLGER